MSNFDLNAAISGSKNPIHALFALAATGSVFVPMIDMELLDLFTIMKTDVGTPLMLLLTVLTIFSFIGVNKLLIRGLALVSLILMGYALYDILHMVDAMMGRYAPPAGSMWGMYYQGGALLSLLGLIILPKYKVNSAAF